LDANGLLTDALIIASGEDVSLDDALALQYRTCRPVVDALWIMQCVSQHAVAPHDDHMVVNTLTMLANATTSLSEMQ
jgi:hypothetical protein